MRVNLIGSSTLDTLLVTDTLGDTASYTYPNGTFQNYGVHVNGGTLSVTPDAIPEPSSSALALLGLCSLLGCGMAYKVGKSSQ